jgi:5-methyltetrahydrofolate--homocysteine methyltransferase
MGAFAVGASCGDGPEDIIPVIQEMREAAPEAILVTKANAGLPEIIAGKTFYNTDPLAMGKYALQAHTAGAQIIGACCGSTPAHIKGMAKALQCV